MARIPIQSLVSARQSGVQIQPGAFQETAQATVNLLSSVSGAVDVVKRQFDQAQDIKNRSDILDRNRMIRDSQGAFQNRMLEEGRDPSEWGPLWKETLDELQDKIGLNDKGIPPAVRREVEAEFKSFAPRSFIQISGAALIENRKRASANYGRDVNYYTQNNRWDEARETTIAAGESNVLTQDEVDDQMRKINRGEEKYTQEVAIYEDPRAAKEAAEADPDLDPLEKKAIIRSADAQLQEYESQELDSLQASISVGEITTQAELDEYLEGAEYITDKNKAKIRKGFATQNPLSEADRWSLKKELRQLHELGEKAPQSNEYYDAFMTYQKKVLSYGPRPGTEAFRGVLYQMEQKALVGKSDTERKSFRSDIDSNVVGIANEMAKGQSSKEAVTYDLPILTEAEYTDANGPGSEASYPAYVKEQKVAAAEAATRRATKQEVLEKAFYDEANKFLQEIPPGEMTPPQVLAKVREHLDKNKNEIILKAMNTAGIEFPFWGGTSEKFSDKQREKLSGVVEDVVNIPRGGIAPPTSGITPSAGGSMLPDINTLPDR